MTRAADSAERLSLRNEKLTIRASDREEERIEMETGKMKRESGPFQQEKINAMKRRRRMKGDRRELTHPRHRSTISAGRVPPIAERADEG